MRPSSARVPTERSQIPTSWRGAEESLRCRSARRAGLAGGYRRLGRRPARLIVLLTSGVWLLCLFEVGGQAPEAVGAWGAGWGEVLAEGVCLAVGAELHVGQGVAEGP